MNGPWLVLVAAGLMLASGFPALLGSRRSNTGQRLAFALVLLGSLVGWGGLVVALLSPEPQSLSLAWHLPWGRFSVGLDALSAVFLAPVFTVPVLGSLFGLSYWRQSGHPDSGRGLGLFYGLLAGAMVLVVIARDSVLLLVSWEIMATSAFFLATTENDRTEVRVSGWIYLVATHAGTGCLLALFALLRKVSGGFSLAGPVGPLGEETATALFVLALVGFGLKAGIMPLHAGMVGADANAPGHVAAVMSGVLLKMGLYGLLRILTLLPATEMWNGGLLLGLGAATGILGAAFAIGQRDLKRMLAYSSVENIGIIFMGIGLAMVGRVIHRSDLVLLGLGGALFHIWNHGLFKPLLFLAAETVVQATRVRDINRMGGLAKSMPKTAGFFLVGAVAICGLPPLNGFVGEWLVYLGLFRSATDAGGGASSPAAASAAVALALTGALAVACFVRAYGMVFLGEPRVAFAEPPQDPPAAMRHPMFLLSAGCVVLGLLPQFGIPLIQQATGLWSGPVVQGEMLADFMVPVRWIGGVAVAVGAIVWIGVLGLRRRVRPRSVAGIEIWRCGYARPTPRMQYTATSFGEWLVKRFAWVLLPRTRPPSVDAVFPRETGFSTEVDDTVLERLALPFFRVAGRLMMKLRLLQQGRTDIYLLYILFILLFLLSWERLGLGK